MLDLREERGAADTDHGAGDVEVKEAVLNVDQRSCLVEANVDGGEYAARDGEKVRRELQLGVGEVELLEDFAGVTVTEDGVGGEVVGRVHEVGVGGGGFAGSGDAGFGVGDDAEGEVDEVGAEEWGQTEDDGGGVAAGVGDEAGGGDGGPVELGGAVYGFALECLRGCGVGVGELVDGAVGVVLEAPGGGEVNDADVVGEGLRGPLAGLLVGRG